ncbi:MAG TPA: cyclic nucleotide-binding domain-containing protein [Mariprofundaceae bacterium]|nr:cyclic nucleotide-binding domain-containing protein [Mariprofundaceae bacterium]
MARIVKFNEGDTLITEGDEDTAAYLIRNGWLRVTRNGTKKPAAVLGPGEIVGELGLAGTVGKRTATVTALTDGSVEQIDRGTLIRLVNGPGSRLVPLLAALFSRLQNTLLETGEQEEEANAPVLAEIEGISDGARRALCNRIHHITRLPWVCGAYRTPLSVTDLFRPQQHVDVQLADDGPLMREQVIQIEAAEKGGLQLHLLHHGDYCELNEERLGYGNTPDVLPLNPGTHELAFGPVDKPYRFTIRVP